MQDTLYILYINVKIIYLAFTHLICELFFNNVQRIREEKKEERKRRELERKRQRDEERRKWRDEERRRRKDNDKMKKPDRPSDKDQVKEEPKIKVVTAEDRSIGFNPAKNTMSFMNIFLNPSYPAPEETRQRGGDGHGEA